MTIEQALLYGLEVHLLNHSFVVQSHCTELWLNVLYQSFRLTKVLYLINENCVAVSMNNIYTYRYMSPIVNISGKEAHSKSLEQ